MKKWLKNNEGSITIEASLVILILTAFILFLISFVKISIAEMALEEAVVETAQASAHFSYLALEAAEFIDKERDGFLDALSDKGKKKASSDVVKYFISKMNTGAKSIIPPAAKGLGWYQKSKFEEWVREKYEEKVPVSSSFFNSGSISITNHLSPSSASSADVVIEAEVTLNIIVPFIEKEVAIKKRAVERAWAGKSK